MNPITKAFSLVELVIVITILGVLASILIFSVGGIFESSYRTTLEADLTSFARFMEVEALKAARERGGLTPYYTKSKTLATADANTNKFCSCVWDDGRLTTPSSATTSVKGKVTCNSSVKNLPQVLELKEKYDSDDVYFVCETSPNHSKWAAALVVKDNGVLGDFGTHDVSGALRNIHWKIFCVSSNNQSPIVWNASTGWGFDYFMKVPNSRGGLGLILGGKVLNSYSGKLCEAETSAPAGAYQSILKE